MTKKELLQAEKDRLLLEETRGEQIRAFLNTEAVQAVFKSLEVSYYEAWKQATSPAERETIHAQASAFDALKESFRAVVASGDRATLDLKELERDTDQI